MFPEDNKTTFTGLMVEIQPCVQYSKRERSKVINFLNEGISINGESYFYEYGKGVK